MSDVELIEVENLDEASDFELKHYPSVSVEDGKVKVEVGKEVPHPQQDDHWIDYIELFVNDELVEKKELSPQDVHVVEFDVDGKSGAAYAVSSCNLHGVWKSHEVEL